VWLILSGLNWGVLLTILYGHGSNCSKLLRGLLKHFVEKNVHQDMKLNIRTTVAKSYWEVWLGFDETLFRKLSPPFPPVKVVRFDGCKEGDIVSLELNFLFFKQRWTSLITVQETTDSEIFFVDKGTQLPFFLAFWQHRHRIIKDQNQAIIADEIEFQTPFLLTDYLFYPLLWLQFAYRKPIYRKVFKSQLHDYK